ncbi:MAG: Ribosomal protein S6--L-glutamate ligase [Phycisphaerae bacterium]|nr:Ribosomal protein S6--L-glutamate ligase [Phycisphaerae bacterium]
MKIAILTRNPTLYSSIRLREAAVARGHEVHTVDYLRCFLDITSRKGRVFYQGQVLEGYDAVIPRIGAAHTFYGTAVVRQFETTGTFVANGSEAIARSRDKLHCMQVLAERGIGLPVTAFAHSTKDAEGVIRAVGGSPVVMKLLRGSHGRGVVLAETRKAAETVYEAFRGLDAQILVQEFIKEAGGSDLRCLVVGRRVVAAMKRQAPEGEFRSNLHRGGQAQRVRISSREREAAVRAAAAMGLPIAGVDLLRSRRGPLVLEVNSSPGLEGIEGATGVDVAGQIIALVERCARANRRPRSK